MQVAGAVGGVSLDSSETVWESHWTVRRENDSQVNNEWAARCDQHANDMIFKQRFRRKRYISSEFALWI